MAYVPIQEKQLQDLTTNGGGSVTTQGGTGSGDTAPNASAITQATAAPGSPPDQFVNFQDMIDANQGATTDYSKNVGSLIGLGDTSTALTKNQTDANNAVTSGYTDVGDDVVDRVLANPSDTNFDGYSTLKSILGGGGYRGPTTASDVYTNSAQALQNLNDKSNTLNDVSSLKSLLLDHPNQGTTVGGASLDAALLANTKGSQNEIANVQKQVGDLQTQYNTDVSGTQSNIDQSKANAAARVAAITGKASTTLGGIRSTAQQAADAKTATEQADVDAFTSASKTGDFSKLRTLIPGLDDAALSSIVSQLTDKPTDYSQYATVQGPALTEGNFVSDADRARFSGIKNTFGLSDADLAAAGTDARGAFNQTDALAALNSRLSSQRSTEAAKAASDAAAQKAADDLIAKTGGVNPTTGKPYTPAELYSQLGYSGSAGGEGPGPAGPGGVDSSTGPAPGISSTASNVASAVAAAVGVPPGVVAAVTAAINAAVANANANNAANGVGVAAGHTAGTASGPDSPAAGAGNSAGSTAGTTGVSGTGSVSAGPATATDAATGEAVSVDGAMGVGTAGNSSSGEASSAPGDGGGAGGVGGGGAGDSAGDGGGAGGVGGGGDSGGGGGGGGGKIICTLMNDFYGLPYRENKVWIKYAKTHLTPAHEKGYHKVFLPLVAFAKKPGFLNTKIRNALFYIGKHRTIDIQAELNGTHRRPVHVFLRAVIEPTLAAIGKWSKK